MAVWGGTGGLSTSGASLGPLVDKPPVPPHTPIYIDPRLSTLLLWVYAIRTVLALDRDAFVLWQVQPDDRASMLHVFLLLADRSDVINDAFGSTPACKVSDYPSREIVRGKATSGRGDVPVSNERLLLRCHPALEICRRQSRKPLVHQDFHRFRCRSQGGVTAFTLFPAFAGSFRITAPQIASWKMMPTVCRRPDRSLLTPCRMLTR